MAVCDSAAAIPLRDVLQVLADLRGETDVVVTNQGSSRVWPLLTRHPLDLHFNPSTMGGCVPLALGIALSRPQRQVLALSGDGSLLMNLGCLVSVVAAGARGLTVILLDNNCYDITGGQNTAASSLNVDFAELARAAGFPAVAALDGRTSWQEELTGLLQQPGPRVGWIQVEPALREDLQTRQEPMADQLQRLRTHLNGRPPGPAEPEIGGSRKP